jgi:hypothetical protein
MCGTKARERPQELFHERVLLPYGSPSGGRTRRMRYRVAQFISVSAHPDVPLKRAL